MTTIDNQFIENTDFQCEGEEKNTLECSICMDDFEYINMYYVDNCDHSFCNDCMFNHCKGLINENDLNIKCPGSKCKNPLNYYDIKFIIQNDTGLDEKYEKFLLENQLRSLDDIMWCQNALCSKPIPFIPGVYEIECKSCLTKMCTRCKSALHVDYTCDEFKLIKDCDSFEEWRNKMDTKLKSCPGCKHLVHKISGCNRVICVCCKTHFCWLCNEKYSSENDDHFDVPRNCVNTYVPNASDYNDDSDSDE